MHVARGCGEMVVVTWRRRNFQLQDHLTQRLVQESESACIHAVGNEVFLVDSFARHTEALSPWSCLFVRLLAVRVLALISMILQYSVTKAKGARVLSIEHNQRTVA